MVVVADTFSLTSAYSCCIRFIFMYSRSICFHVRNSRGPPSIILGASGLVLPSCLLWGIEAL